jgi:hypothetical protein
VANRVVYTNGQSSFLMEGDPDKDEERYFFLRNQSRVGAALPQLLAEGWVVTSVTSLPRQARGEDDWGCALVVLTRTN